MSDRILAMFGATLINVIWETSNFLYVGMHKDLSRELVKKHNTFMREQLNNFCKDCREILGEEYGSEEANKTELKEFESVGKEESSEKVPARLSSSKKEELSSNSGKELSNKIVKKDSVKKILKNNSCDEDLDNSLKKVKRVKKLTLRDKRRRV